MNQPWIGEVWQSVLNVSRNAGKSFKVEKVDIIFATYFFVSEEFIEHSRIAQNTADIASNLGGIASVVFATLGQIGMLINNQIILSKIIRKIFLK